MELLIQLKITDQIIYDCKRGAQKQVESGVANLKRHQGKLDEALTSYIKEQYDEMETKADTLTERVKRVSEAVDAQLKHIESTMSQIVKHI